MNTSSANMPESRSVLLEELQPFNAQTAHTNRKPPHRETEVEPLLAADDVAKRLNVSTDWVWDHSSRKKPLLPVIRMGTEPCVTAGVPSRPSLMNASA